MMLMMIVAAVLLAAPEPPRNPLHREQPQCVEFWEAWDTAAALDNQKELDRLFDEGKSAECDVHGLLEGGVFSR